MQSPCQSHFSCAVQLGVSVYVYKSMFFLTVSQVLHCLTHTGPSSSPTALWRRREEAVLGIWHIFQDFQFQKLNETFTRTLNTQDLGLHYPPAKIQQYPAQSRAEVVSPHQARGSTVYYNAAPQVTEIHCQMLSLYECSRNQEGWRGFLKKQPFQCSMLSYTKPWRALNY